MKQILPFTDQDLEMRVVVEPDVLSLTKSILVIADARLKMGELRSYRGSQR